MDNTTHPLSDYLSLLEERALLAAPVPENLDRSAPVALVSYDSREVVPGTLFLCKGAHFRVEFLSMARDRGAIAYVSQTPYPEVDLPCLQVNDMRLTIAPLADRFYNHPSGRLKVIALTGTKGKTTTAYYLKAILDEYMAEKGRPECGLISSIETVDGVERFESHLTTPEPLDLQRHLAHAVQSGMEYLVMEASSQALKYHRSLCTDFASACFLNIGTDHISPVEHPNFEDYFASKLRIFRQGGINCVNLDCDHADQVLEAAQAAGAPLYRFSRHNPEADVYASQIHKRGGDILFRVRTRRYEREFRLTMPGLFNVDNALAAIAVCEGLQIPQRCIYAGLVRVRVPGRMEVYPSADGVITAIVDFAHNRMSFENLCRSAQEEYPGRRIVSLFGSVGDKALDRRKDLGEIGGRYSHQVILTEDDSGEEDTLSICREIAAYVAEQGCPCTIELNRGEAIRQAVLNCREPTVLLIAGKGDETYQKRGQEYVQTPTDGEYAQSFLREYDVLHRLDGLGKIQTLLSLLPALKRLQQKTLVLCGSELEAQHIGVDALRALGMRVALCPPEDVGMGGDYLVLLEDLGQRTALERVDRRRLEELMEAGQLPQQLHGAFRTCLQALGRGTGEAAILDRSAQYAPLLYLLEQHTPGIVVTA